MYKSIMTISCPECYVLFENASDLFMHARRDNCDAVYTNPTILNSTSNHPVPNHPVSNHPMSLNTIVSKSMPKPTPKWNLSKPAPKWEIKPSILLKWQTIRRTVRKSTRIASESSQKLSPILPRTIRRSHRLNSKLQQRTIPKLSNNTVNLSPKSKALAEKVYPNLLILYKNVFSNLD
jgi:hypothetical protein